MAELPIQSAGNVIASSAISSTRGVLITANTSTNTKGAWTQLIASTAVQASGLMISILAEQSTATVATVFLVDIGFGAAASESVVIPNLAVSCTAYATLASTGVYSYFFPITVPASTRISARYQGSRSNDNLCYVTVATVGGGTGMLNGSGTVEAWGPDTSVSKLIELDPGGSAGTKGSYSQLIASTARKTREITIAFANPDNDSGGTDQVKKVWSVDIAVGGAGSEQIIIPDIPASRGWSICFSPHVLRLPISIPSGTRVAARCCATTTSTGAPRKIAVAAYGIG